MSTDNSENGRLSRMNERLSRREFAALSAGGLMAACSPAAFGDHIRGSTEGLVLASTQSLISRVRVFSDEASLKLFGLDKGVRTIGDGLLRLASNPSINCPRGQLLECSTANGAGQAYHIERVRLPNSSTNLTANSSDVRAIVEGVWNNDTKFRDASLPVGFWQTEFVPVVGEFQFLSAHVDTAQQDAQFRSWVVDAGGGKFQFALNSSTSETAHPYGLMIKARIAWDEAGNLTMQSNAGPGWQQELSINDGTIKPVSSLRRGIVTATKASDVRFSSTAFSKSSFADMDHDFYSMGSRLHGIDRARASLALFMPDGMIAGQAMARLRHRKAAEPVSTRTSCWRRFSDRRHNTLELPVSRLTPDTDYIYQFEVADGDENLLWISEPRSFKTL